MNKRLRSATARKSRRLRSVVGRCCGTCLHQRIRGLDGVVHLATDLTSPARCVIGRIAPRGRAACGAWTANAALRGGVAVPSNGVVGREVK
jgi:hypothetical protein